MSVIGEVVTAAEVPVKILCYGSCTPSKLLENPSDKPKELVVVIPGNPGIAEIMHGFGKIIHRDSGLPVWTIGHGGHSEYHGENRKELYNVAAQIRQKEEIIARYLKDIKIRLIGHSFGCYVALKLMASDEIAKNTSSAYLISPVVEQIALTPLGSYIPKKCFFEGNAMIFLAFWFNLVPTSWKEFFAVVIAKSLGGYKGDLRECLMIGLNYNVMTNLKTLAMDELTAIKERDDETIRKNVDKLRLYYMGEDGYVPRNFMYDMIKTFPTLRTQLDGRGTEHAFMEKSTEFMANVVVEWLREDCS